MNQDEYGLMVQELAKAPHLIRATLTDEIMDLLHGAVGISGEAGELLDAVKKLAMYNKPLTDAVKENIVEELGDLEFFMEMIRRRLLITRASTLTHNFNKLTKKRYPSGYSDMAAQERADKIADSDLNNIETIQYEMLTPLQLVDGWNKQVKHNDVISAAHYEVEIKRRRLAVRVVENPETKEFRLALVEGQS